MSASSGRKYLLAARRVVVKVGTALLTRADGSINRRFITKLAGEIAGLLNKRKEVIVVTSGAIGAGVWAMPKRQRPKSIPAKQAMAAIGQPRLMQVYAQAFKKHDRMTAQILLTAEDVRQRQRYAHARSALNHLLKLGIVPIVNENDSVAVDEIKFGDNDTLSAHITNLSEADLLIILTDVAGLFDANPGRNAAAKLLTDVFAITPETRAMASGAGTARGTGGMRTKILAAEQVTQMGECLVIADGRTPQVLERILNGETLGTLFHPAEDKMAARKRWIAFALKPRGSLVLDEGAAKALIEQGSSLLPSGIIQVHGNFKQGDPVSLLRENGLEIARGLVHYDYAEIEKIKGRRTAEITAILGYRYQDEVIHRDDLALLHKHVEERSA